VALFGKKTTQDEKEAIPIFPEDIYRSGMLQLKDVIAPSALEVTANHVRLGEKLARTLYVFSFPRFLASNWFSPVINMDKVIDISIFIHPVDTTVILKKLQRRVAEIQSQVNIRQEKGLVRDPMLDAGYQNLEQLRDSLQQAEEKLFLIGIYLTIYGDTADELDKIEISIKSILESRLVYLKPALFQQKEAMDSTFPMALDLLKVNNYLNSSPASTVFPFVSFDLTANRGILYGINAHNNSLVLFDRFGMENYNSVMFARSGSGKSYTAKLEVIRSLMFDVDVIIIDPEKEYEYLAEAVGGRYFNISLSSHHHINPFDLPMPREDEAPSDVLRSHIINLVGLFRLMFGGYINMAGTWYVQKEISGGGIIIDNGPHAFDLVRHLLGEIKTVKASVHKFQDIPVEDTAEIFCELEDGATGNVDVSWSIPVPAQSYFEIYGEEGAILLDFKGLSYKLKTWDDWKRVVNKSDGKAAFERQTNHFVDSLAGRIPLVTTPEDGLKVQYLIDSAYKSLSK